MVVCGQHDLYGVVRVCDIATKAVSPLATSPPLTTTLTGVADCRRGDPLMFVFRLVTHCVMRRERTASGGVKGAVTVKVKVDGRATRSGTRLTGAHLHARRSGAQPRLSLFPDPQRYRLDSASQHHLASSALACLPTTVLSTFA